MPALLLLLPVLFVESAVLELASGLGCILVVAIAQAVQFINRLRRFLCFCRLPPYPLLKALKAGTYPSQSEDPLPYLKQVTAS